MRRSKADSGWSGSGGPPLWLMLLGGVTLVLGTAAGLMSLDLAGWTRSPLCGLRCYDAPIERALTARPQEALKAYRPARQAAMRQLQISPFDTAAWIRVVLLEIKTAGGTYSPSAADALAQSYLRAPVDASVAKWRLPLAFSYWGGLTPGLRGEVLDELEVLYSLPQNREFVRGMAHDVHSPEGQFAFNLALQSLDEAGEVRSGRETPAATPKVKAQSAAIAGD